MCTPVILVPNNNMLDIEFVDLHTVLLTAYSIDWRTLFHLLMSIVIFAIIGTIRRLIFSA